MIPKFLTELSPLGKKLLAGAVAFAMIALFDFMLIRPTLSRMATIDQDIVKEESVIKQELHFLGYKNKILVESQALESYLTDDLPAEEELIAAFLKRLEMLATKANVSLIKVTPSTGSQEKDYLKFQADLECSGKLADVISFMHVINSSDDLMKVIKFNFSSKKADTDELKSTMTINKAVISRRALPSQIQVKTPGQNDGSKSDAQAK